MSEKWKPIIGWVGFYEVSDLGRVRSVDREIVKSNGRIHRHRGQLRKIGYSNTGGYADVTLRLPGKQVTRTVHSLVMEAFVGPRPIGLEVLHTDGDGRNSVLNNLSYGTRPDNTLDQVAHGRHNNARKILCKNGHPLSGDNLYIHATSGERCCRTCGRQAGARYRARKRAGTHASPAIAR